MCVCMVACSQEDLTRTHGSMSVCNKPMGINKVTPNSMRYTIIKSLKKSSRRKGWRNFKSCQWHRREQKKEEEDGVPEVRSIASLTAGIFHEKKKNIHFGYGRQKTQNEGEQLKMLDYYVRKGSSVSGIFSDFRPSCHTALKHAEDKARILITAATEQWF